ncbi:AAA family ATPase [Sorangium sp. So ce394]|uniref:AAA family ATPase n=1 Tax=Sorangium sp. So ce394 TaxID=3133310 RepID=UPI003F5AF404
MIQHIPIGVSDFRALRERGLVYVDKTHLIQELLDRPGLLGLLLPRPRRFGKTLNLSMLRYFFERRDEDLSHLFEGLSIWRAGEAYRAHFQRYPVVFMTFRDVTAPIFEACWKAIQKKIEALFDEHRALLDAGALSEREARDYRAILDGTADEVLYRERSATCPRTCTAPTARRSSSSSMSTTSPSTLGSSGATPARSSTSSVPS